ncbi:MAG: SH3 domain-containing protein [Firmicutes bacterium]|nr:SH3 domain-containing protein [Bacillota bacterium]
MRKYLLVLMVILVFVIATAYFNRVGEDNGGTRPEDEQNSLEADYPDLGGTEDVKLYPVDEAAENPEFEGFRKELIAAVRAKDVDFIRRHTHETIRYTFGINEGIAGFFHQWGLDTNPDESRFWDELLRVVSLGGSFRNEEKTSFVAPYVFSEFPEDIDAFQHVAIIDKRVKVYAEPSTEAEVLGTLTYSIVRVLERHFESQEARRPIWLKIETFSGNSGYIPAEYGRSPVDYRGNWIKTDGTWKMIFFVAGD